MKGGGDKCHNHVSFGCLSDVSVGFTRGSGTLVVKAILLSMSTSSPLRELGRREKGVNHSVIHEDSEKKDYPIKCSESVHGHIEEDSDFMFEEESGSDRGFIL